MGKRFNHNLSSWKTKAERKYLISVQWEEGKYLKIILKFVKIKKLLKQFCSSLWRTFPATTDINTDTFINGNDEMIHLQRLHASCPSEITTTARASLDIGANNMMINEKCWIIKKSRGPWLVIFGYLFHHQQTAELPARHVFVILRWMLNLSCNCCSQHCLLKSNKLNPGIQSNIELSYFSVTQIWKYMMIKTEIQISIHR